MAILRATMATSLERGKGFGRAQWSPFREVVLLWVCEAGAPSLGFSLAVVHGGQDAGMATIYPTAPSRRALSAAKDAG